MDKKRIKSFTFTIILVVLLIAVDQIVKMLVDIYLMPIGTTYPIWDSVFHLTSVHNTGAAFGMLSNSFWFLVSVRILASLVTLFLLAKYNDKWHMIIRLCVIAILAGALGNLIDQLIFGYVRDMFDFRLINFAVFNVADSYITVGAIALAAFILFSPEDKYIIAEQKVAGDEDIKKEQTTVIDSQKILVDNGDVVDNEGIRISDDNAESIEDTSDDS